MVMGGHGVGEVGCGREVWWANSTQSLGRFAQLKRKNTTTSFSLENASNKSFFFMTLRFFFLKISFFDDFQRKLYANF